MCFVECHSLVHHSTSDGNASCSSALWRPGWQQGGTLCVPGGFGARWLVDQRLKRRTTYSCRIHCRSAMQVHCTAHSGGSFQSRFFRQSSVERSDQLRLDNMSARAGRVWPVRRVRRVPGSGRSSLHHASGRNPKATAVPRQHASFATAVTAWSPISVCYRI